MTYEAKTKPSEGSVEAFLDRIESARKRDDAYRLLALFTETTGLPARLWGDSLIGFGSYHYKYKSGHEGDAMLVGFSPRKAKISLYLYADFPEREAMLGGWVNTPQGWVRLYQQTGRYPAGGVAGADHSFCCFHSSAVSRHVIL
jgi:hypothetical protein